MTFVSEGAFARDGLDWRVRWAFACNILLACASFAIVMPSIAPFLFSVCNALCGAPVVAEP